MGVAWSDGAALMATTIYSSDVVFEEPLFLSSETRIYEGDVLYAYPYPRAQDVPVKYRNKVWDTIAGQWVFWETTSPDAGGKQYPGPGSFGVETLEYAVEAVVFGRYMRV